MSQSAVKIACVAAFIAIPLTLEWKANAALRMEIAKIRSAKPKLAAIRTETDPLAQMKTELAEKHAARLVAENRVAELLDLKNKVETEVVISLGSVDTIAKKIGKLALQSASGHRALVHMENFPPEERAAIRAQFQIAKDGEWELAKLLYEIPRLERVPEKAARCYATLYGERAGLEEDGRALVEKRVLEWQRELQNDGLTLPQRPKGKAKEWDQRRQSAERRFLTSLTNEVGIPKSGIPNFENLLGLDSQQGTPTWYEFVTSGGL